METHAVELSERTLLHQGYFRLERLSLRHWRFDGGTTPALYREVVSRGDIVAVLPYDARLDEVVFIEQFRLGPYLAGQEAWIKEIVAGHVKKGESLAAAAVRETHEEIGTEVLKLEKIGSYFLAPHQSPDMVHMFLGHVDAKRVREYAGLAEEGEDIRVMRLPRRQALAAVARGEVVSPWTLAAMLWLAAAVPTWPADHL
jgi:ADP-ribose pyrophosphatase